MAEEIEAYYPSNNNANENDVNGGTMKPTVSSVGVSSPSNKIAPLFLMNEHTKTKNLFKSDITTSNSNSNSTKRKLVDIDVDVDVDVDIDVDVDVDVDVDKVIEMATKERDSVKNASKSLKAPTVSSVEQVAEPSKKKTAQERKKRTVKDKDAPKAARTAWNFFRVEQYAMLRTNGDKDKDVSTPLPLKRKIRLSVTNGSHSLKNRKWCFIA